MKAAGCRGHLRTCMSKTRTSDVAKGCLYLLVSATRGKGMEVGYQRLPCKHASSLMERWSCARHRSWQRKLRKAGKVGWKSSTPTEATAEVRRRKEESEEGKYHEGGVAGKHGRGTPAPWYIVMMCIQTCKHACDVDALDSYVSSKYTKYILYMTTPTIKLSHYLFPARRQAWRITIRPSVLLRFIITTDAILKRNFLILFYYKVQH
jgi:hypothetical protein